VNTTITTVTTRSCHRVSVFPTLGALSVISLPLMGRIFVPSSPPVHPDRRGLSRRSYRVDVDVGWLHRDPDRSAVSEVELCDGSSHDFGGERDRPLDAHAGSVAGWMQFGRSSPSDGSGVGLEIPARVHL
jgi:hypothetical protein